MFKMEFKYSYVLKLPVNATKKCLFKVISGTYFYKYVLDNRITY